MDILKAIKDMQERFYKKFGDINISELSQHEKHLTWMTSFYIKEPNSTEENPPAFSQSYCNKAFALGYRIGRKENEYSYNQGFEAGKKEAEDNIRLALGFNR